MKPLGAAIVESGGRLRPLDRAAQADEQVTEDDVADAPKLARLLTRAIREIADVRRRFAPRHMDFENREVTDGSSYSFTHGFGGRVRYWPVEWSGAAAPGFSVSASTDANTLVVVARATGTVTLRVEEAG